MLIGEDRVLVGCGDRAAFHDVIVRVIGRHGGGRDDHLSAERAQQSSFFLGHLVGHRENAAIALHRRGQRQSDSSIPGRRLDNQSPRLEPSLALGSLDHCDSDTIFDRPAGIKELRLRVHRRPDPARDLVDPDQWSPADRLEDVAYGLMVLQHRVRSRLYKPGLGAGAGRCRLARRR
jgi:hypothetical protein